MNIIGNRGKFVGVSVVLVVVAVAALAIFGFRPAIDFTGGTLWQLKFENSSANESSLKDFFVNEIKMEGAIVYKENISDSLMVKMKNISEEDHQKFNSSLNEKFGKFEELKFESIGPTVGDQLRSRAVWAIILVLFAISVYISISFRKASYPIKSWKYGVATLVCLFHDVIIPAGLLAVLGRVMNVEIDTNFIVALLVIMGFSVHDTIVVFDRIRENLLFRKTNKSFDEVVNDSVNQTLARSINTTLTLVLVLVAMFVVGAASLKMFVLVILVGTVIGTYSSIFVASPLLTIWHKFSTINKK